MVELTHRVLELSPLGPIIESRNLNLICTCNASTDPLGPVIGFGDPDLIRACANQLGLVNESSKGGAWTLVARGSVCGMWNGGQKL